MDISTVLQITKDKLGIRSNIRDEYISAIILSIIEQLKCENNLNLDLNNMYHINFICDYSTWRYESKDISSKYKFSLPRHLQYRLHNLIINNKEGENNSSL